MKRLLHSMTTASVAAVIILAGNNAVGASDKQTFDPAQNTAEKGSDILAPDDSQKVAKSGPTTKVNVDSEGVILKGYDVVAYFKQRKPVQGNLAFESTYQGAAYLFASAADKADFDKDPAKYVPQYGGFCAYAAALGNLGDVEGTDAFAVYKGKLYMCANQSSLEEFKANIDTNIGKADANWQLIGSISKNAPSSRAGSM
jgi:YHS domain-containing protein